MARTTPPTGAWLNAIVAFHHELMCASRNEALYALWPAIQTTLRWSIKLQMMLPTLALAHDPVADHARVFEKVTAQNAEDYDVVVRYADREILESGWLVGEEEIAKKAAVVSAKLGQGRVVLIGFPAQHRAQTHGTYKLLFNAMVK